jgi:hypothetical protein
MMTKSVKRCVHAFCCGSALVALIAPACAYAVQTQAHTQLQAAGVSAIAAAANVTLAGYGAPPPLAATALNYYVSPAGNDTSAGSQAAPFRTLSRAAAAMASKAAAIKFAGGTQGMTVWVAPGTYYGGFKTTASGNATPSGRIFYVSTTQWGARIVPSASGKNKSAWNNRGDYVSIVGFDVDGSKTGTGVAWRFGLYSGGSHTHFHGNKVHHIANTAPCTSAGGSAIGVDSYYKGVKGEVTDNVVHDIGQSGCRFVQGIYISTSAVVRNNVVSHVAAAGIHLWHDANDVVVTNNTVSWSTHGIIVGGGDFYWRTAGADNIRVQRNVLHDNLYGVSETGKTGCNNVYRDNLAFNNTYNWSLKACVTITSPVNANPRLATRACPGAPEDRARRARSGDIGQCLAAGK